MPSIGFVRPGEHGWRGSLHGTLGAGSSVQFLSALAGFASLPLTVGAVGSAEFGVLIVITSLAPWLTIVDLAVQSVTRLFVGEARAGGPARAPTALLRSSLAFSLKAAGASALVVTVCLLFLPVMRWFGAEGVVDPTTLVMSIGVFCVIIIAGMPGGVFLGALEGVGRGAAASAIAGSGPLLALPLTFLAARNGAGLVVFSAIQGLAVALPRFIAWAYWRWRPSLLPEHSPGATAALRLTVVAQIAFLGALHLVQNGLDPMIVAGNLGADAAAQYGIALRLVAGCLIPVTILAPLIGSSIAAARGRGWGPEDDRALWRLLGLACVAGTAMWVVLALVGPILGTFLGAGEVEASQDVYVAAGAYVAVSYAIHPLTLTFQGPTALRFAMLLNAVIAVGNVVATVALVTRLGPAGPMWASAAAGFLTLLAWILVWRVRPTWLRELHVVPAVTPS
jgi:O-antigen/teichoic acid export membrane protein